MTLWLLGTTVAAGVLSWSIRRSLLHRVLGAVSFGVMVAAVATLPAGGGEYELVLLATVLSLGLSTFGGVMLLARGHPRRPHRHIIYCGYGLVFAIIAVCWAVVARYPGPGRALAASLASLGAYV